MSKPSATTCGTTRSGESSAPPPNSSTSSSPFPPDGVLSGGFRPSAPPPHHPPDAPCDLNGQPERGEPQLQPAVVCLYELHRRHDQISDHSYSPASR